MPGAPGRLRYQWQYVAGPNERIEAQSVSYLDYGKRLGEIHAPTLLYVGRFDPQPPVPCSLELEAGIPDSRLVIFEHSGHSPFVEEPAAFMRELDSFLC